MTQFRMSESRFAGVRKKQRRAGIIVLSIVLLLLAGLAYYNAYGHDVVASLIGVSAGALFMVFSYPRTIRRQWRFFQSYVLTLTEEGMIREVDGYPTIAISYLEIKEIVKTKKGSYLVTSIHKNDVIGIPYWVDNIPQLEEMLEKFAPIRLDKRDPFKLTFRFGFWILLAALVFTASTFHNSAIVIPCGILAFGGIVWYVWLISSNRNIPAARKRVAWIYLIVISLLIFLAFFQLYLQSAIQNT